MNEIVKYHNDINKLSFSGFNEKELNLFFSLCYKAQENHNKEIELSFIELRNLSNGDVHLPRFLKTLKGVYDKLIKIPFHYQTDNGFGAFTLFNKYFVDTDKKTVTIRTSDEFLYMLNDLIGNFTKFELENFVNLKSSYSKNMFKMLKQWESIKEKIFSVDELRSLLNAPVAYDTFKFNQKIIKQFEKELPEFFPNLKIEKIKAGRVIKSYKFTWGEKHQDINYVDDIEIEISDELNRAFKKAEQNRFIKPFLTDDNKAELVEVFEDEKALIKGLNYAYKTIQKDFKRLSYLIKTITTGIATQEKVIKVKKDITVEDIQKDNVIQTSFAEIKKVEKKDITEDEFNKLYNQFLIDNNITDNELTKKSFSMPYNIIKSEIKKTVIKQVKKVEKKVYTESDIPEDKLLGKNGKKLVGGALKMRVRKILEDMNK